MLAIKSAQAVSHGGFDRIANVGAAQSRAETVLGSAGRLMNLFVVGLGAALGVRAGVLLVPVEDRSDALLRLPLSAPPPALSGSAQRCAS